MVVFAAVAEVEQAVIVQFMMLACPLSIVQCWLPKDRTGFRTAAEFYLRELYMGF